MRFVNGVVVAAVFASLIGCVGTQTRMISSADELELRALAFAEDTRYPPGYEFAAQARAFRDAVAQASGDQSVVLAYRDLWRGYHALRNQVELLDQDPVRTGFGPVRRAFVEVQRSMTGYAHADTGILARGGYVLDPYYND